MNRYPCEVFNCQLVKSFQITSDPRQREALGIAILEPLYPLMYSYLRGFVPPDDLDDVTQDTMIALMRSIEDFNCLSDSHFRNLTYRIAKTRIAEFYRQRARKPEILSLEAIGDLRSDLASTGQLGVEEKEVLEILRSAEPELFESIWARVHFDISFQELASELNTTPDAIRVKINRAFVRLRKVAEDLV